MVTKTAAARVRTPAIEDERDGPCFIPERLAAGLDVLQEKWALAIVYVLMRGPVGFNECGRGAGAVNATTLTQRLARLESAGLVKKTVHSFMPPRTSYELTEAGRALKPVIAAIERWSDRYAPEPVDA